MREIKFRAWDEINQRLLTENIVIDFNSNLVHILDEKFKGNPTMINTFIPLQYTGLKDKNSVEIYEGDIIKIAHVYILQEHIVRVIFDKSRGAFKMCVSMDSNEYYSFMENENFTLEVRGNIYENPELLEPE